MYSFDMFRDNAETYYPQKLNSDRQKLSRVAENFEDCELYTILLATHLHNQPPEHLDNIIKYSAGARRLHDEAQKTNEVRGRVHQYFAMPNNCQFGSISCGKAFGIGVSLYYWLARVQAGQGAA